MNRVVFLIIILIVLVIIILISKINIAIRYTKTSKYDVFLLSFFLNKLLIYKYQIPTIDVRNDGVFYRFKKGISNKKGKEDKKGRKYIRYTNITKRMKKARDFYLKHSTLVKKIQNFLKCKITLKKLKFNIRFGTGNACQTSILTGILWTLYGIVISFLYQSIKIEKKEITIKPNYVTKGINVYLYCIFSVRIVYIIVIGFMILAHFTKRKFTLSKVQKCVGG